MSMIVSRGRSLVRQGISMEAISFQRDGFGTKLEMVFKDIIGLIAERPSITREELQEMSFDTLLSSLIFARLGLKTKVIFNTYIMAAILPFFVNDNDILNDVSWHNNIDIPDQKKLLKSFNGKKGFVDLEKAKVSGVYSEFEHPVYIDVFGLILYCKFDSGQFTALLLHELGHAFTHYEFASRTDSSNQILAQIVSEVLGKNDMKKRVHLFQEVIKLNDLKSSEFDDLMEEPNNIVLGAKLFKKYMGVVKSQIPNASYDLTTSEQLADNFAARFGYGRQLISALEASTDTSLSKSRTMRIVASFSQLLTLAYVIVFIVIGLMSGSMVLLFILSMLSGFMGALLNMATGEANHDRTYDDDKIRYTRIKHQYIELVKDLHVSQEIASRALADIKRMDQLIDQMVVYRTPLSRIKNVLFSKHRDASNTIMVQQLLEELAHNSLFAKSAELKTL